MENLESLYKKLELYKDFDAGENAEKFLNTIDNIVAKNDPKCLKVILPYFDDDSEFNWVLESVSCSIEHLDREQYVHELRTFV